jgi:eukaryotic-like serine/threonine-protein kinase
MGELRSPIVGRDEDLAVLHAAFGLVGPDRAARVVIAAPPGVGKTRLVQEFVRRSTGPADDTIAWRVRLRPDVVAPYQPMAQLILGGLVEGGLDSARPSPSRPRR